MSKQTDSERAAAIEALRQEIKPGETLRTILRHVSRSGMTRRISVVQIREDGETRQWDALVAKAIGEKVPPLGQEGIKISGAGMDMGFELVYRLSMALYGPGHGYMCLGEACPSNSHVNNPRAPYRKGHAEHIDGYAISQRWL